MGGCPLLLWPDNAEVPRRFHVGCNTAKKILNGPRAGYGPDSTMRPESEARVDGGTASPWLRRRPAGGGSGIYGRSGSAHGPGRQPAPGSRMPRLRPADDLQRRSAAAWRTRRPALLQLHSLRPGGRYRHSRAASRRPRAGIDSQSRCAATARPPARGRESPAASTRPRAKSRLPGRSRADGTDQAPAAATGRAPHV